MKTYRHTWTIQPERPAIEPDLNNVYSALPQTNGLWKKYLHCFCKKHILAGKAGKGRKPQNFVLATLPLCAVAEAGYGAGDQGE
jgi:hypothetical protein